MGKLIIKEIDKEDFRNNLEQKYKDGEMTFNEVMEAAANSAAIAKQLNSEKSFEMFYVEE